FLLPDIRYIRYIRPCESVAELPSSFFLLPSAIQSLSPAMQNPGALVTVKAAIKPPGFKFFLLNEAQFIANGCWLNQQ
ncbi:hypothetical protein QUB09_18190, partial [Microcoleus sp. C2C6]